MTVILFAGYVLIAIGAFQPVWRGMQREIDKSLNYEQALILAALLSAAWPLMVGALTGDMLMERVSARADKAAMDAHQISNAKAKLQREIAAKRELPEPVLVNQ